jgi:hypothetical protein
MTMKFKDVVTSWIPLGGFLVVCPVLMAYFSVEVCREVAICSLLL